MTTAVVIATCRQESIDRWFKAWRENLKDTPVFVVEDNPEITFELPTEGYGYVRHSAWSDVESELGDKAWIIPRRTSALKSYGFLQAARAGCDTIWTLDDDCFPEQDTGGYISLPGISYVRSMESILTRTEFADERNWFNTLADAHVLGEQLYPRGYPYGTRNAPVIHHGMWSHIPDLDGVTALKNPDFRTTPAEEVEQVPFGKFFPMCGMNLAFKREMLPAMYFMLQGHMMQNGELTKLPYDRFDDIWAGLFAKKIADHLSLPVTTGFPSIMHTKESDPQERVTKEAPGIETHEKLWSIVRDTSLSGYTSVADCYSVLASELEWAALGLPNSQYWYTQSDAMNIWTELTA